MVRLDLSKKSNENKVLTARTFFEIDELPLAERAIVMNFSLTENQILQHDEWVIRMEKLNTEFEQHFKQNRKKVYDTRYENGVLYIDNTPFDFRSAAQASVFLKELFKGGRSNLAKPRRHKDFYDDHRQKLASVDIKSESIRYIRKHIESKTGVTDFFPEYGLLTINSKYLS